MESHIHPLEHTSLERLQADVRAKQKQRDEALAARAEANQELEAYHSSLEIDPAEDVERKEQEFEEQKELVSHWLHIKEVFLQKKQALSGNPMQDISDKFTHYLSMITDDKISSEFPDANKLNMQIYSDDRLVDYGKLSEGTKETVFLAFRLAVLDHLFPDGGGVIVLDDPFTDMDDARTVQSCKLVQECAKRHQIIFLTCKEEYLEMLNGNVIKMES
jgi:DNA repair exonuclease SbcCD ATPase subunit